MNLHFMVAMHTPPVVYADWEAGKLYYVNDIVRFTFFGGDRFICLKQHTSSRCTIPGYSSGWQTYWAVY